MPSYKLFLVAPGRVGQAIGKLLHSPGLNPQAMQRSEDGIEILGLWARREESAKRAASFLQTKAYWGPFPEALNEANVVLVTPPERFVAALSEAIAPSLSSGATILHTAGSLPPTKLSRTDLHSGALHPLQSIASAEVGVEVIPGSFMAISGDDTAQEIARDLAQLLGGTPVQITDPVLYHLGAVMASNTLYPLFAAACSLLERAGVSGALAPKMLLPLVRGSVENIGRLGAARGLTGPIARADAATISRHLRALETDPEMRELYRLLSRRALTLAEEAGADERGLQEIATLLEE